MAVLKKQYSCKSLAKTLQLVKRSCVQRLLYLISNVSAWVSPNKPWIMTVVNMCVKRGHLFVLLHLWKRTNVSWARWNMALGEYWGIYTHKTALTFWGVLGLDAVDTKGWVFLSITKFSPLIVAADACKHTHTLNAGFATLMRTFHWHIVAY